jgi:glycosyltransferase involved in cell wall biosynthesis
MKTLSIIIPVYNEEMFVAKAIAKVLSANTLGLKKELIVINDGSTDGTLKVLRSLSRQHRIKLISFKKNKGKGSAIQAGLKRVSGQVVVIQDADLEYNPDEYRSLLVPILDGDADVVYGSRFMGDRPHRVLFYWHMVGNKLLTTISNMFTNLNLTDMETGYKMFSRKVAKRLKLKEARFGFEPEFTAKVGAMGCRIYEIGVSYHGRGYEEGKKIHWQDGLHALWCILKYNVFSR